MFLMLLENSFEQFISDLYRVMKRLMAVMGMSL